MHLQSFPKFFSSESHGASLDSPFPPLRTDHRYKGVYERAGFDVNLGSDSCDDRSSRSKMSPSLKSPASRFPKTFNSHKNHSSGSLPRLSPTVNQHTTASTASPNAVSSSKPYDARPSASHLQSSQHSSAKSSPTATKFYPDKNHFKPFEPERKNSFFQNGVSNKSTFEAKNKNNLTVRIPPSEPSNIQIQSAPVERSESSLNNELHYGQASLNNIAYSDNHSGNPSSSSAVSVKTSELGRDPPLAVENGVHHQKDLMSSLADLRNDVEEHRVYDPRSQNLASAANTFTAPKHTFVPVTGNHLHLFNKQSFDDSNDSLQEENSYALNSARHSSDTAGTAETSSEEIDNFLQARNKNGNYRTSQLSTISSIISKSVDENVEGNESEDEVELELRKQLDSFKTTERPDLKCSSVNQSNESFVSARNETWNHDENSSIPVLRVSSAPDDEPAFSENAEVVERVQRDQDSYKQFVHEGSSIDNADVRTPFVNQSNFNDPIAETPETIMPLSPKNHFVERELEDLNFPYKANKNMTIDTTKPLASEESNDERILSQNPTPVEFEAFPRSIIDPQIPSFRDSTTAKKATPGTGPCRSCGMSLLSNAKGSEKPVFSKAGDLSGQWHRGCFKCSYSGCPISFNKKVVPYVLLDNPFCNHHYHTLNNTLCDQCHLGIEGECIENELKQKWHLNCLKCTKCHEVIGEDYYLINHQIVCEKDAGCMIDELNKSGLMTSDKVEKRRTRVLFVD